MRVRTATEGMQAFKDWTGLRDPMQPPTLELCGLIVSNHTRVADVIGGCLFNSEFQEWKVVSVKEVGRDRSECCLSRVRGGEMCLGCISPYCRRIRAHVASGPGDSTPS